MTDYPTIEGTSLDIHPLAKHQAHPLASIFPFMSEVAMQEHISNIKEHGQKEPIVLLEGRILDGRNTYYACCEAGVSPVFRQFGDRPNDGDSPANFVYSRNFHRRNLSPGQKAAVATNFIPHFEHEAKLRQQATQFKPKADTSAKPEVLETQEQEHKEPLELLEESKEPASSPPASTPIVGTDGAKLESVTTGSKKGRVRDKVAQEFGTSSGMVKIAHRLKKKAPDLFEKVLNGEMKAGTADAELDRRIQASNEGENALKKKQEREDAIAKIESTWSEKKYEDFVNRIKEKKILVKHDDLLVFSDLAKSRAIHLIPLIKLSWGPVRAQEFLDGKIEEETALREILLFAISKHKGKPGKAIEHQFEITSFSTGEFASWTVSVYCDPTIKPAPVETPEPKAPESGE